MTRQLIIGILVMAGVGLHSQQMLRISYGRMGEAKTIELFTGDYIAYKLKGENGLRKNKIYALTDSIVVFDDEREIKISELKCLFFRRDNMVINVFQSAFLTIAAGFFLIDTANNLILERPKVVNEAAALVSLGFFTGGMILKRLKMKKFKIPGNAKTKAFDLNYNNLGPQG